MDAVGRWKESAALVAAAAVGVPLGVNALVSTDPELIRGAVGVLLVAYGAAKLVRSRHQNAADDDTDTTSKLSAVSTKTQQQNNLWTLVLPFGFLAGLLGGAVAEPGPPAVVLSQLSKWDAATTRVMLFRFFLPVQLLALVDYSEQDLLTPFVVHQTLAAIPAVALAVALGTFLNRRIDPGVFEDAVSVLVAALGLLCCATVLGDHHPVAAAAAASDAVLAVGGAPA
mmetsp:Transcript_21090/g.84092  ORF Transcript_21090/g.84092 Transcript_21090/m.84092 type:complete len:227 (-) Transcript_21090:131-811(-)